MFATLLVCLAASYASALPFDRYLPENVAPNAQEFSYHPLFNNCNLAVYDVHYDGELDGVKDQLGEFPQIVDMKFSQWFGRLDDVMYDEAFFFTLDFRKCYSAFEQEYGSMNLESVLRTGSEASAFRIGGIVKEDPPISHANTLIVLVKVDDRYKLVMLRGNT